MKVPSFQSLILKHLLSFSYLELFAGLFLPSDTWCASLNKTFSYCTHMFKHSSWHCKVHSLSLKPSLAFSEAITSTVLLSLPPWLRAPRLMHWLTKNTNSKVIEQETGIIYIFPNVMNKGLIFIFNSPSSANHFDHFQMLSWIGAQVCIILFS